MVTFDIAFDRLMVHEGGYVNHPTDPGGETNWGISKRAYPHLNIRTLTREDAKKIYHRDYWVPCGQHLHPAVTFQVFDGAVNHGVQRSIMMLQKAIGVVDDGWFGAASIEAYKNMNPQDAANLYLAERLEFFTKLKTFPTFGRGWTRRIVDNLRFAASDIDETKYYRR